MGLFALAQIRPLQAGTDFDETKISDEFFLKVSEVETERQCQTMVSRDTTLLSCVAVIRLFIRSTLVCDFLPRRDLSTKHSQSNPILPDCLI